MFFIQDLWAKNWKNSRKKPLLATSPEVALNTLVLNVDAIVAEKAKIGRFGIMGFFPLMSSVAVLSELKMQGVFVEKILLMYFLYIGTAPNISKKPFIQC